MAEDGKGLERIDEGAFGKEATGRPEEAVQDRPRIRPRQPYDTDAALTVEGSIQGLNLKEFFLLLSSTGLAYRRCELVRVNGAEMDIQFLRGKNRKKRAGANGHDAVV